jgi:hypothetical protein
MYILLFPSCILQCILLLDVSKKDTSALLEQDQSDGFMESSSLYLSFSQGGVLREKKKGKQVLSVVVIQRRLGIQDKD